MANPSFLWVAVYDVRDASRQAKVREVLRFKGTEVRSCVYEILATQPTLNRLQEELALILGVEDAVRIYRVCQDCRQSTALFGDVELANPTTAIIV